MQIAYLVKLDFARLMRAFDIRIEGLDSCHLIGVEKADMMNPIIMEYFSEE